MRNLRKIGFTLTGIAALAMTVPVSALATGSANEATATAKATVDATLTVARVSDPNWGHVAIPTTGNATYELNPSTGAISKTGINARQYGTAAAGEFSISGQANADVSLSIEAADDSSVEGVSLAPTLDDDLITLDGSGAGSVKVGGTLTVPSNATSGDYTQTVTLTADYS